MSNSRVSRGIQTQVILANDLKPLFPHAVDVGPHRQGKDILNTEGFAFEVKARSNFDPMGTLRQAKHNAAEGELPVAVCRMNGQGPANVDEWVAFLRWGDLKLLIQAYLEANHVEEP
jgi:hypothetical protein